MSLFDTFFPAAFAPTDASPSSTPGATRADDTGGAPDDTDGRAPPSLPGRSGGAGSGGCGCGCRHGATDVAVEGVGSAATAAEASGAAGLRRTLNQWTLEHPEALTVFAEAGLDTCCGGERSLLEACRLHGLDPRTMLRRLEQAAAPTGD